MKWICGPCGVIAEKKKTNCHVNVPVYWKKYKIFSTALKYILKKLKLFPKQEKNFLQFRRLFAIAWSENSLLVSNISDYNKDKIFITSEVPLPFCLLGFSSRNLHFSFSFFQTSFPKSFFFFYFTFRFQYIFFASVIFWYTIQFD